MMEPDVSEVTAVLSRTPGALRGLLEGLPEGWYEATEGEATFSPPDVVGHLIHGEKTDWMPRVRLILESGDARPFVPFDRLGFREAIRGRPVGSLLDEFESLRRANLDGLRDLAITPAQLALKGLHPELGPVTLGQLLATWAVHDLNHVGQVVRVMSKRYSATVGPWKAYLGILNR
jgi:DinB superfamily